MKEAIIDTFNLVLNLFVHKMAFLMLELLEYPRMEKLCQRTRPLRFS